LGNCNAPRDDDCPVGGEGRAGPEDGMGLPLLILM